MASAPLSPGTPSSFLVRALTSWGEGKNFSRELKAASFTRWEGAGKGRFGIPRRLLGLEEGRERAANRAGRGETGLRRAVTVLRVLRPGNRCCARGRRVARSVLGPGECPRFHSLYLRLPSSPQLHSRQGCPAAGRAARVGKCRPLARPTPRKPAVCNGLQCQSGVARVGDPADGSRPAVGSGGIPGNVSRSAGLWRRASES